MTNQHRFYPLYCWSIKSLWVITIILFSDLLSFTQADCPRTSNAKWPKNTTVYYSINSNVNPEQKDQIERALSDCWPNSTKQKTAETAMGE